MRSILALIRYGITDQAAAGQLVRTSSRLLQCRGAGVSFVCLRDAQPDRVLQLPADALLPMEKFLANQPLKEFWFLMHRPRMLRGDACFVRRPRALVMGRSPHRFESEGEVIYYMNLYELNRREFIIAKTI